MRLPEGWEIKKLVQFATKQRNSFANGPFGSDLLTSEFTHSGVPVIYIRDIKNGRYQRKSTVCITEQKADSLVACMTSYGDIIITKLGDPPCEAAIYTDKQNAVITQDVIRIKTINIFTSYFLSYLINSDIGKRQVKRIKIDGTRERVSLTDFKNIKLPYPPLPEQQKIAQILSTWDKAIEKLEALIAAKQKRKKALMQQLLTGKKRFAGFEGKWHPNFLGKVAEIVMGSSPKSEAYNEIGDGLPLLQGNADIKNRLSAPRIYTSEITKTCSPSDILLSVRAPVGSVARSLHKACIGRGMASIKAKNGWSQDFLYQWLLFFEQKWDRLSQGSTFESVNSADIKNLHIIFPESLEEQQKIATVLSAADKEIEIHQKQISVLKQQKKGLMQQLLTGKLRVKLDKES